MDFYDRYIDLCNERNISPSRAGIEMGLSKTAVSNWKARNTLPTDANLLKIADYFGVSVEYLKGETDQKHKEKTANGVDGLDAEIISLLGRLTDRQKKAFVDYLKSLLDN